MRNLAIKLASHTTLTTDQASATIANMKQNGRTEQEIRDKVEKIIAGENI